MQDESSLIWSTLVLKTLCVQVRSTSVLRSNMIFVRLLPSYNVANFCCFIDSNDKRVVEVYEISAGSARTPI